MSSPIRVHTGRAVPLVRSNVDTDQIVPAVFCKRLDRTGYEDTLFYRWRKDPDFVLNQPAHAGATILIAGADFGIGSSREHAVWALRDYGFRAVIAPSFGDIFTNNARINQLIIAQVQRDVVEALWRIVESDSSTELTVDLDAREVRAAGLVAPFHIDDHTRWQLMQGLDDIGVTLQHTDAIAAYERRRAFWLPAIASAGGA